MGSDNLTECQIPVQEDILLSQVEMCPITEGASPLHHIFVFLLHMGDEDLAFSSLRVYLALILAHHPLVEGFSVFTYKAFSQGPDTDSSSPMSAAPMLGLGIGPHWVNF